MLTSLIGASSYLTSGTFHLIFKGESIRFYEPWFCSVHWTGCLICTESVGSDDLLAAFDSWLNQIGLTNPIRFL